jgi:hypothetical protein
MGLSGGDRTWARHGQIDAIKPPRRKYDVPETNVLIISPFPLRKK